MAVKAVGPRDGVRLQEACREDGGKGLEPVTSIWGKKLAGGT